jgi:hypothetical protein
MGSILLYSKLEFLKRLWGLGTEEEEGHRTGPPGYMGWRNSFLGIDSGAPYTFKSTNLLCASVLVPMWQVEEQVFSIFSRPCFGAKTVYNNEHN